jgi:hypothetical protein
MNTILWCIFGIGLLLTGAEGHSLTTKAMNVIERTLCAAAEVRGKLEAKEPRWTILPEDFRRDIN